MKKAIPILLIAIVLIVFCKSGFCQCMSTSSPNGSSFSNDGSIGTLTFSNPSNAKLGDGNYATATSVAVLLSTATTEYLKVTGFNFGIPITAYICGIEVNVTKKATGINVADYVEDNAVKLVKAGTVVGNNYALTTTKWSSSSTTVTYGGPTDLWNVSWAISDLNSSSFGVVFSANITGTLGFGTSANIDQVQINVYYDNTPLGISLENFTATKNGDASFLTWAVNEDNDFNSFIIQRSSDISTWKNIAAVQGQKNQQQYLYADENPLPGTNYYRIEAIKNDSSISYSSVSMVSQQVNDAFRIFPNPASDNINITYKTGMHVINIRDEFGRTIKSYSVNFSEGPVQIPVSELSTGYYFVQIEGSALKLWKK